MSSLSLEQINALLKGDKPQPGSGRASPFAPIIHVGQLRYANEAKPCASRNCRSPTLIRVNGIVLCSTHALFELNRILIKIDGLGWVIDECTCTSGKHSYQNMHADDCAVYERLKALQEQVTPEQPGQL
jgi:hypothetical protein